MVPVGEVEGVPNFNFLKWLLSNTFPHLSSTWCLRSYLWLWPDCFNYCFDSLMYLESCLLCPICKAASTMKLHQEAFFLEEGVPSLRDASLTAINIAVIFDSFVLERYLEFYPILMLYFFHTVTRFHQFFISDISWLGTLYVLLMGTRRLCWWARSKNVFCHPW